MLGVGVGDELVVDAERLHLLVEVRLVLGGHEAVRLAVADEHGRLELTGLRLVRGGECAVEAHHAAQRHAETTHVQRQRTPQAIAHRADALRVDLRMRAQLLVGRAQAIVQGRDVGEQAAHQRTGFGGVSGLASIAIDIHRERGEAEPGELAGAPSRVIIEPPPFRKHEHPRALAVARRIPGEVAGEFAAAGDIAQDFGMGGVRHGEDPLGSNCAGAQLSQAGRISASI